MIASVLDNAQVICSTNIGSGHRLLEGRRFPIVLMDEATQAVEPSALIPISKGCRQLILVGDHKQLPPTVISKKAEQGGLGRSLFERLIDVGIQTHLLDVQYRMHPVLREFPSARFYDDRLNDGCNATERPAPAGILWPDWDHPFAFIPIDGVEDEEQEGGSRSNPIEAARIYDLVRACWSLVTSCPRILESSHHTVARFVPFRTSSIATKSENKEVGLQVSKSTLWMDIRVEKRRSSFFQPYVQILTVSLDS